jgi:hypothetical protein
MPLAAVDGSASDADLDGSDVPVRFQQCKETLPKQQNEANEASAETSPASAETIPDSRSARKLMITTELRDRGAKQMAIKLLDRKVLTGMSKLTIPKAGIVASNMLAEGYEQKSINQATPAVLSGAPVLY